MNSAHRVHDIGGVEGWGAVPYEPDEEVFHYDWERRVFGLMFQVLSETAKRPGEFRHALERLSPEDYFCSDGYYGRWRAAMEVLLDEYGHVAKDELDDLLGVERGTGPGHRVAGVAEVDPQNLPPDRLTPKPNHRTVRRELEEASQFEVGDRVIAAGNNGMGHTRLPEYVRNIPGTVVKLHPAEVLPDSTAHNLGERPQHVVCVAYRAKDLWGQDAEEDVVINVDLYENYLAMETELS